MRYIVPLEYDSRQLLSVLRQGLRLSATMVRRLKHTQGLFVNGEPSYTNRVVHIGDMIEADIALAEQPSDIVPEDGELDILLENEGLLAVNKPAGLITHPTHSRYTGTLANFASGYLLREGSSASCHAVNRLDRDTSGVILFAKGSHWKTLASQALAQPVAEKEYVSLVWGSLPDSSGTIDLPIRRLREGDMLRVVAPDGQRAVTSYTLLGTETVLGQPVSAVSLLLGTGRTHQIRVHMAHIGHPLLGDSLYGSPESLQLSGELGITAHTLHALRLSFRDPVSGSDVSLRAPLKREDMKLLQKYIETKSSSTNEQTKRYKTS